MEQITDSEDTAFGPRLQGFVFERILLEGKDPRLKSIARARIQFVLEPEKCRLTILGSFPTSFLVDSNQESLTTDTLPAIIRIEKTAIPVDLASRIFPDQLGGFLSRVKCMENTDIEAQSSTSLQYMWLAGWISASSTSKQPQGDVKVNIICPATEVHVRKYSKQSSILVRETPEMYKRIVEPYITDFPPERTRWRGFQRIALKEILEGRKEQSKILFSSSDFILLPDMKWDLHTTGSLYLIAIARDGNLRSLRDLRGSKSLGHIALLKSIRREASIIAQEKWGIEQGGLRMYIHYQPSYYHFHVHIVNANYEAGFGMSVGQAHLLEDVISLLELDEQTPDRPGIFERMTLTYGLGEQHGLYVAMRAAQAELEI
ncbi:Scavenger mrna decapping enzyme [Mycena sanguinolenta]|uniref:Scavenger mrna decapping enzyme n=1 Tax=Mycena sanguinolenta TaxID=230812 RepID=A0A8H6Z6D4_9AGAR|nr:Scavenger mrna decapping enzyme [Mycena sanguinolenta]